MSSVGECAEGKIIKIQASLGSIQFFNPYMQSPFYQSSPPPRSCSRSHSLSAVNHLRLFKSESPCNVSSKLTYE